MTAPGLALFYGGMVRRKNVLAMLMQSFILAALISVQWVLFGYSLAFSPGNALDRQSAWIGLHGVSATQPYADYAATVPHQAYMIFQCMFAVITPALITGAFAERISFRGFLIFSLLWSIVHLRSARALGMGHRWMATSTRRAGFRRRHGGAHFFGHLSVSGRLGYRPADAALCASRCRRTTSP